MNHPSTSDLRELRLLAERSGSLFQLCKLIFTRRDASIYLVPYAKGKRYFCGSSEIAEHEVTSFLNVTNGAESDLEPKLSIHQTGQVHVQAKGTTVGMVKSPPLNTFRGQHLGTVCFDNFDALEPYDGPVRNTGAEREFVFTLTDEIHSGRFAIYANATRAGFDRGDCLLTFTLVRPTLTTPLFVGIHPIAQPALGERGLSGVTVIAGWDPSTTKNEKLRYVYLRGT